jgi:hypothetical protein
MRAFPPGFLPGAAVAGMLGPLRRDARRLKSLLSMLLNTGERYLSTAVWGGDAPSQWRRYLVFAAVWAFCVRTAPGYSSKSWQSRQAEPAGA